MALEQSPPVGILTTSEQVVAGIVTTTTPTIVAGSGFTVAKNATGDVTITFSTAFTSTPTVNATSDLIVEFPTLPTTTNCRLIRTTAITPQAGSDGTIHFLAYVPSAGKTRVPKDFGFVTALPTSPAPQTGDLCTYTDSLTSPTYNWDLRYNASDSSSTKWEFRGGSPIATRSDGQRSNTGTTFANLPTDPMSLTLPLAGDYDITIQADLWTNTNLSNSVISYAIGATAANDAWALVGGLTGNVAIGGVKTTRQTGVAAASPIAEKVKQSAASTGTYQFRRLFAIPVRVG